MIQVFVSGTFDIIHGGHIRFFKDAKSLGDYLIVSFASDLTLMKYKGRKGAMPEEHKRMVLESLRMVDEVVMGSNSENPVFDFEREFIESNAIILASTTDDLHADEKRQFALAHGARYVQIPKWLEFEPVSTTQIRTNL